MVSASQALRLLKREGAMLESGRGPFSTLTEAIAGERIRGSWWGHPKGKLIFAVLSEVHESEDVAVCKLVEGKITLIHRRLWPALFALAGAKRMRALDRVHQEHQPSGEHRNFVERWPDWVPTKTREEGARLAVHDATAELGPLAPFVRAAAK